MVLSSVLSLSSDIISISALTSSPSLATKICHIYGIFICDCSYPAPLLYRLSIYIVSIRVTWGSVKLKAKTEKGHRWNEL